MGAWYAIDWLVWLVRSLDPNYRKMVNVKDFLFACLFHFRAINQAVVVRRQLMLERIKPLPSTLVLEELLNDAYDPVDRRIWIDNATIAPDGVTVFQLNEIAKDPLIYRTTETDLEEDLITRIEEDTDQDHFKVMIPAGLSTEAITQIRARTRANVIYQRRFSIVEY